MKRVRHLLSAVLCVSLMLSLIGIGMGASPLGNPALAESPALIPSVPAGKDYSEKLVISFAQTMVVDGTDMVGDEMGKWWRDNYNIEWEVTNLNDMEKLRIWINSGDMPDMSAWNYVHGEAMNYIDQELLYRLPDDWKTKWPNAAKAYAATQLGDELEKLVGGTYLLPRPIFTANKPTDPLVWHTAVYMRKDWAEAVGFPLKDYYTASEMLEFARLIREKDPGKVGANLDPLSLNPDQAIGMFMKSNFSHCTSDLPFYKGADGKYTWGPADEAILTGLKLYQQAYREKLINPEFYTLKGTESDDKVWVAGTAAAVHTNAPANGRYTRTNFFKTNLGLDPDEVAHLAFIVGEDGKYHDVEVPNFSGATIFSPNIDPKKFERVMDMIDYLASADGQAFNYAGFQNIDWKYNDAGEMESLLNVPIREKYPSEFPIYCNMFVLSDDFNLVNPTVPQKWRENCLNHYLLKASLSDATTVPRIDWDAFFYDSPAKQKVNFDYKTEYAQLIVKDGDLEANWRAWVESKMPLVQPVLDELNSIY